MSHYITDNPWNAFLQNIVHNKSSEIKKLENQLKIADSLRLIHSIPIRFIKCLDLVTCKKCNITISKAQSLNHIKRHEISNKHMLNLIPYMIEIKEKTVKKSKNSQKSRCKLAPKNRINSKVPKIELAVCEKSTFVPKSILSSEHPLKLKIQLQPKSKELLEESDLESKSKTNNIFENLQTAYPTVSISQKANVVTSDSQTSVRSLNDFIKHYEGKNETKTNLKPVLASQRLIPVLNANKSGVYAQNKSMLEHVSNSKTKEPYISMSNKFIYSSSNNNYKVISKPVFTYSQSLVPNNRNVHKPIFHSNSQSFYNQSNNVFHNYGNNILRLSGQRKFVRIQNLEDNINSSTTWHLTNNLNPNTNNHNTNHNKQLYSSNDINNSDTLDDLLSNAPISQITQPIQSTNSINGFNIDITQQQFQRRLIQKGLISENDVIRCSRTSNNFDTNSNIDSDISNDITITHVTSNTTNNNNNTNSSGTTIRNTTTTNNNRRKVPVTKRRITNNNNNNINATATNNTNSNFMNTRFSTTRNSSLSGGNKNNSINNNYQIHNTVYDCFSDPNNNNFDNQGNNNNTNTLIKSNRRKPQQQIRYPSNLHSGINGLQSEPLNYTNQKLFVPRNKNLNSIKQKDNYLTHNSSMIRPTPSAVVGSSSSASSHYSYFPTNHFHSEAQSYTSLPSYLNQYQHNHHHNHHNQTSASSTATSTNVSHDIINGDLSEDEFLLDQQLLPTQHQLPLSNQCQLENSSIYYHYPHKMDIGSEISLSTCNNNSNKSHSQHHHQHQHQQHSIYSSIHPNIVYNHTSSLHTNNSSDPEVISHGSLEADSLDSGIHILPSPGKKIIDLPWDI